MRPEEIESGIALAVWLKALPAGAEAERNAAHHLAVAVAHRAAMRVLPVVLNPETSRQPGTKEVLFFRLNLIAGVAAVRSGLVIARATRQAATAANTAHTISTDAAPAKTREAISSATNATRCAAYAAARDVPGNEAAAAEYAALSGDPDADINAVHDAGDHAHIKAADYAGHAVDYAGMAAHHSSGTFAVLTAAFRADLVAWEAGRRLQNDPLWPGENPFRGHWARAREVLLADEADWTFWVCWYDKALTGAPQDWAGLLTEVALIKPREWEKGAEYLNALIGDLRLKHAISATPVLEKLKAAAALVKGFRGVLDQLGWLGSILKFLLRLRGDG